MKTIGISGSALLLFTAGLALPALAQGPAPWPNRAVRLVIPFAPGGASDFVGRIIAAPLGQLLGQQIIADNRGGAAGNIGMEIAAKAAPDGYTLYQGNIGTLALNPGIYKNLSVRPTRDFAAVTQVVDVPGTLVAHPSLPVRNAKELIAFAKARPGQINFGSPGGGSANRLEMEFFMRSAGIEMVHIPYKGGAGPAATALMGGETALMFVTISSSLTFVKAGRLKALGVVAPQRVAVLPDVPTMAEQGFPQMTSGSWQGVLAPSGTPREIVDRLFGALQKVMAQPEVVKRLADGGVDVVVSKSPEEFAAFIARETERWGKVIRDANVTAE